MKHTIPLIIAAVAVLGGCSKQETPEQRLVNQTRPASSVTPASGASPSGKAAEQALIDQIKPTRSMK